MLPGMSATLVIDDDTALLASLEAAARLSKIDLVTASSWDEGLMLFQILSPDLVIADYNMPGSQHGLRLLARIRQLRPSVRLVLVSGYLDEDDIAKVMTLGVVDEARTKGTSLETASALTEEARVASAAAGTPTDWVAYARAYISSTRLSDEDLDSLDALLTAKVDASGE
jgi:DNA-binding NtrC family response regulator